LLDFENIRHQYAFKIEGVDSEWNFVNENSIRLSGLPYGNYTLVVKGKKLGGQWSNKELHIPVIVKTPVTRTWWFFALIIAGTLVAFVIIYRWRTRRLLKAKLSLETTVENRTQELRSLLGQKDLLMKEIHHRVKNNLQVISSLLDLQRARAKDENIKIALQESQNRVMSIAIIHQNLYRQDELKGVEMHGFANELSKHIKEVFQKEDCPVTIENNFKDLYLDIDTAVPIGLIMNELLTNSFKYAFEEKKEGQIKMHLEQTGEGNYFFSYFDNGKGLPPGQSLTRSNSMGLRLITGLGKQVGGEITYTFDGGSKFELHFKNLAERSKTL
jgi:two-component sensor histidine kinase